MRQATRYRDLLRDKMSLDGRSSGKTGGVHRAHHADVRWGVEGFGEAGKGEVGGESRSFVFLARGLGVRALLPPVVVALLGLGLITLWTAPGVLLPLWLSRLSRLWCGVQPGSGSPPVTHLEILFLVRLALLVPGPVAPAKTRDVLAFRFRPQGGLGLDRPEMTKQSPWAL